MQQIRVVISGMGNIGSRFVAVLNQKSELLKERYSIEVRLIAAVDITGALVDADGLELESLASVKGQGIASVPGAVAGLPVADVLSQVDADVLMEATPVNLETGEPGLSTIRQALSKGMHVITTNKGPLALAYPELRRLADANGVKLRHCGAVFGGLPAVSIAERDLAAATFEKVEAQANLANSFILDAMSRGVSYADAVQAAKDQGCAAQDETLDVEGWDAAIKLVILANSVLGMSARLDDVVMEGITHLTAADVMAVAEQGRVLKYVAAAVRQEDGRYALSVGPKVLDRSHLLAPLGPLQMGVAYTSDLFGTICASILEEDPTPSASSLLRDLLIIYADA